MSTRQKTQNGAPRPRLRSARVASNRALVERVLVEPAPPIAGADHRAVMDAILLWDHIRSMVRLRLEWVLASHDQARALLGLASQTFIDPESDESTKRALCERDRISFKQAFHQLDGKDVRLGELTRIAESVDRQQNALKALLRDALPIARHAKLTARLKRHLSLEPSGYTHERARDLVSFLLGFLKRRARRRSEYSRVASEYFSSADSAALMKDVARVTWVAYCREKEPLRYSKCEGTRDRWRQQVEAALVDEDVSATLFDPPPPTLKPATGAWGGIPMPDAWRQQVEAALVDEDVSKILFGRTGRDKAEKGHGGQGPARAADVMMGKLLRTSARTVGRLLQRTPAPFIY